MKATLVKPLYSKHIQQHLTSPDWLQKSKLIYQETAGGILKGFWFDSSAYSATEFYLYTFIKPLYIPSENLTFTFGYRIKSPKKIDSWEYNADNLDLQGLQLATDMNKADKDFLSRINTAEDFYNKYKGDRKIEIRHFEAVAYSAAYAQLKVADGILKDFLAYMQKQKVKMQFDWAQKLYAEAEKLLQSNQEQRKTLMQEWLSQTRSAVL